MSSEIDIADVTSFLVGQGRTIEVRGQKIALFRLADGEFHAIADACSHHGSPLGAGYLEGCDVYCPMHGWAFDVRTGECRSNANRPVARYPVNIRDGKVWIREEVLKRKPLGDVC